MKPTETAVNAAKPTRLPNSATTHRSARYQKVLDGRKQPIRGLWVRNNRFLARITVSNDTSGRKEVKWVPLEKAQTVPQAQVELRRLLTCRDTNKLPALKRAPKFADYVQEYFRFHVQATDASRAYAKRPATLVRESCVLKMWVEHLGETRLDKITKAQINAFRSQRQANGLSGRTVNLDIITLRNVLKRAIDDGWIKSLPTENMRPLKWIAKKRELVPMSDIERLCESAQKPLFCDGQPVGFGEIGKPLKNGQQLTDYVKLMALCGARRDETLRLRWKDVDFERRQLTIGADGLAKNGESRVVNLNDELEQHLEAMFARRAPDSQWLFPSPQRGDQDIPAKTFRESVELARKAAGLPNFGFHDCRHFFISRCVMSGIDYMTIARWVGHKDGGVLIGKVYGHLSNEHAQAQAARLNFGPAIVALAQAANRTPAISEGGLGLTRK